MSRTFPHLFRSAILGFVVVAAPYLMAQESEGGDGSKSPGLFFESVDVDVVNVEVFVTDRKGNAVTGLKKEDFRLTVDGVDVPVSNFYSEVLGRPVQDTGGISVDPLQGGFEEAPPDQRLHLIVYVDNDNIRPQQRKRVFNALREFLASSLSPEDYVTVASARQSAFTHSDFMKDRRTLNLVLDDIQKSSGMGLSNRMEARNIISELSREGTTGIVRGEPTLGARNLTLSQNRQDLITRIANYAASEYSQSRNSIAALGNYIESIAGVPGRKAILHVSSGIATRPGEGLYLAYQDRFVGSITEGTYFVEVGQYDLMPQFRELSRRANAAGVTFYALDAEPNHASFIRSAVTEGIASQTSASFRAEGAVEENFRQPLESLALDTGGQRLYASPTLARQLSSISTDFNTFYSLGFVATGKDSKKSHRIKISIAGDKSKGLRVRHRADYTRRSREDKMASATVAALLYNSVDNPLEVTMTSGEGKKRDDGRMVVPVDLEIPLENVTLLPNQGVHAARISLFVTVKNERGEARPVQKVPFALDIPDEFVEQAKGDSARYTLPLIINPGDQQVAIGIRDEIGAGESTLRLELPKRHSI